VLRITLCVLSLSLASCGGSSSETPFPLEPDLSRLDGGANAEPRYVVYGGGKAPAKPEELREEAEPEKPAPPPK